MGGYGGGGFIEPKTVFAAGDGFRRPGVRRGAHVDTIPALFQHLRDKLGWEEVPARRPRASVGRVGDGTGQTARRREDTVEDILPPEQIEFFKMIRQ
ncbi:MAG: hypothetical protein R2748_02115 [Bryobacterales bacterium]